MMTLSDYPYDTLPVQRDTCADCGSVKCECPTGTDPYGHLAYSLSDAKGIGDLICWDYALNERKTLVRIHSVVNSESAGFIQDFMNVVVPAAEALPEVLRQIDAAVDWFEGERYVGIRTIRRLVKSLAADLGKEVPDVPLRSW